MIARWQLLEAGCAVHDVKRLLRGRLVVVRSGIYSQQHGEPTWEQRAWAGVLVVWPAALTHESALRAAEGPESTRGQGPIQVAVDRRRKLLAQEGLVVIRCDHLTERVNWQLGPPRFRYEEAVLDVAAAARTDLAAVDELARAVHSRRTTPARLSSALEGRARITGRDRPALLLPDVADFDRVGNLLRRLGWMGSMNRCGPSCPVTR